MDVPLSTPPDVADVVAAGPLLSPRDAKRQRKQVERAAKVLGVPVVAASPTLMVEGMWPWYIVGTGLGAALGGVPGALLGGAVGYGIGRLVTRGRADGIGFLTVLALTPTHLHALRCGVLSSLPKKAIASCPREQVRVGLDEKRWTSVVTVDTVDGRRLRMESHPGKRWSARTQAFVADMSRFERS
jgi:hypothetical protein